MKTSNQIFSRMKSHNTLVCCGLDPDLSKIPSEIGIKSISDESKVLEFLCSVVDITAPHICAYKVQKAFFDILPNGHDVLKNIIEYVHLSHPGLPVIIDCKIGDIENTMQAYIKNIFELLKADGVVVNPYMGDDVILPLVELSDKAILVLVKTSNKSSSIVQDVTLENGQMFWQYMLELVVDRWNDNKNMIPVISSTGGLDMAIVRSIIPDDMPILFAGVGAQGGNFSDLQKLLNSDRLGVFVNSSRGILYSKCHKFWQQAIEIAVVELKESLNSQRVKGGVR